MVDARGTFDGSYEYQCCRDSGSETDKSYSQDKITNMKWFRKSDTTRYLYDNTYALSIWNFNTTIGIWVANYSEHANLFDNGDLLQPTYENYPFAKEECKEMNEIRGSDIERIMTAIVISVCIFWIILYIGCLSFSTIKNQVRYYWCPCLRRTPLPSGSDAIAPADDGWGPYKCILAVRDNGRELIPGKLASSKNQAFYSSDG